MPSNCWSGNRAWGKQTNKNQQLNKSLAYFNKCAKFLLKNCYLELKKKKLRQKTKKPVHSEFTYFVVTFPKNCFGLGLVFFKYKGHT